MMRKFIAILVVAITVMALDVGSASAKCKRGKRGGAVAVSQAAPTYTQASYYGTSSSAVYTTNSYPYNSGSYYAPGVNGNGYVYPNNYGTPGYYGRGNNGYAYPNGYGSSGYYGRGYNNGPGGYVTTGNRGFRGR